MSPRQSSDHYSVPPDPMAMQTGPGGKIDRQSTVPFHLKLFYRTGGFRRYVLYPLPIHLSCNARCTLTLNNLQD